MVVERLLSMIYIPMLVRSSPSFLLGLCARLMVLTNLALMLQIAATRNLRASWSHCTSDRAPSKLRALVTFVVIVDPPFERSLGNMADSEVTGSGVSVATTELHICMRF